MGQFADDSKCERLNQQDLIYQSSEQYLILCLQICNLIVRSHCNIDRLIDFNRHKEINATLANKSSE